MASGPNDKTITLEFAFHEEVIIKEISQEGYIDQVLVSFRGVLYKVIYFMNGDQKEAWVLAHHLTRK